MRRDPIVIVPYDASWRLAFEAERERVEAVLRPWLVRAVEHVGSTSIPGMAAKPIVDMVAVVRSIDGVGEAVGGLRRAGWVEAPEPGDEAGRRRSFCTPSVANRTHHLHVVEESSEEWRVLFAFRDYLRAHPGLAVGYAALKRELAAEHGADPNRREAYREGKRAYVEEVTALALSRSMRAMEPEANLDEALLAAAGAGDSAAVRRALKDGANVEAVDFNGRTSLVLASEKLHLDVVKLLLEAGAYVDAQDGFGRTALMEASLRGGTAIMRALLDAGADTKLVDGLGETALLLACSGRARDTVPVLLAHHADAAAADRDKKTALMWIVDLQFHRGSVPVEVIQPLVAAGAKPNAKDQSGRTALMWAVRGDAPNTVRPTVLKALLDNGVDVNLRDDNEETALFGLVRTVDDVVDIDNGRKCIAVLVGAGADRNARNNEGKTPLGIVDPRNPLVIDFLKGLGFQV